MTDLFYFFDLLMCSTPPKWGHTTYTPCMYNAYKLWTPMQSGDTHNYTPCMQTVDTNVNWGRTQYTYLVYIHIQTVDIGFFIHLAGLQQIQMWIPMQGNDTQFIAYIYYTYNEGLPMRLAHIF